MLGPALRELDQLFRTLPGVRNQALSLLEVLELEVGALHGGHAQGAPALVALLRLHAPWPGEQRSDDAQLLGRELSLADARQTIARLHRFESWADAVAVGQRPVDPAFEAAADAIVAGDAPALRELLQRQPELARARSPFAHRATLLHYVAANGVEELRQWQSPANAVEIAQLLLDAGADPDATCSCYGNENGILELLVTSAHPAAAGVQAPLVHALCAEGAHVNGPKDDDAPLWAASRFGYTPAVDALVQCGARREHLVLAAAAGDLAAVQAHFDADGRRKPSANGGVARVPGRQLDERYLLEYALIQAALHGRHAVVALLLSKQPDLSVREPSWNTTALSAARWAKHAGIAALIEAHAAR